MTDTPPRFPPGRAPALHGWDYLLVFSEEQVNRGLAIAYHGAYVGPPIPRLPGAEQRLSVAADGQQALVFRFGCPTLRGERQALNQCWLTIPLLDARLEEGPDHRIDLPHDACLRIRTSLTWSDGGLDHVGFGRFVRRRQVHVDIRHRDAVLETTLGDAHGRVGAKTLAAVLHERLKKLSGREFPIGALELPEELDNWMPQHLEFAFVVEGDDPKRNSLVVCGARREPPASDSRLLFTPAVRPPELPAALWCGGAVVLGEVVLTMLRDAFWKRQAMPDFKYEDGEVRLKLPYDLGDVEGHPTVLESMRAYAANGRLAFEQRLRIYAFTGYDFDAVVTLAGHLAFERSADGTAFACTRQVDSERIDLVDKRSTLGRVLAGIITAGASEKIVNEVKSRIRGGLGPACWNAMDRHLGDAAAQINGFAARVPALQDLGVGGHLVFAALELVDGGAVFVGIAGTARAAPAAPSPPHG